MDKEKLLNKINQANEKFVTDGDAPREAKKVTVKEEETLPEPVDLYRQKSRTLYEAGKKSFPRGAKADIEYNVRGVVEGADQRSGLKSRFALARKQADYLKRIGDRNRSNMVIEQYMRDEFLPAIEALVGVSGADMLLNSTDALKELDKYAIVIGGRSDGYTATFIRELHSDELGTTISASDAYVSDIIRQIRTLIDADQIRSAVGLADKTMTQIDNGLHTASDEDYVLLEKVASR